MRPKSPKRKGISARLLPMCVCVTPVALTVKRWEKDAVKVGLMTGGWAGGGRRGEEAKGDDE